MGQVASDTWSPQPPSVLWPGSNLPRFGLCSRGAPQPFPTGCSKPAWWSSLCWGEGGTCPQLQAWSQLWAHVSAAESALALWPRCRIDKNKTPRAGGEPQPLAPCYVQNPLLWTCLNEPEIGQKQNNRGDDTFSSPNASKPVAALVLVAKTTGVCVQGSVAGRFQLVPGASE